MFRATDSNNLESDEGFSIEVLPGRSGGLIYREGNRKITIPTEMLVGTERLRINPGSIKRWNPPNEEQQIEKEERDVIVDNIRRAFLFWGNEIHIAEYDLAYHGPWTKEDVADMVRRYKEKQKRDRREKKKKK